jgi:hypothetical protein
MTLSHRWLPRLSVSALLWSGCCFHGTGEGSLQDDAGPDLDAGARDAGSCVTSPPTSCDGLPLVLSPAPCAGGLFILEGPVNQPWELPMTASCGTPPYQWNVVANSGALPPGLSLDETGRLAGLPTQPGVWFFEVSVTDSAASTANQHFELAVTPQ